MMSPCPVSSVLKTSIIRSPCLLLILHTPSSFTTVFNPSTLISKPKKGERRRVVFSRKGLTIEKLGCKIDAHVGVPGRVGLGVDNLGYALGLDLVDGGEDAVAGAEADDDAWHVDEEGLDPVLHELAVEGLDGVGVGELGRRLELDPVDRLALFLGLGVPDYLRLLRMAHAV